MTGEADPPAWTFAIPYYNEADFLPATLASLIAQTLRPFRLILIDNGSTDGSAAIARAAMAGVAGIETVHLSESRPGKIHALEQLLDHVDTRYLALGDADTLYPPHYLAQAQAVLEAGGARVVAAMAIDVYGDPEARGARCRRFVYPRVIARLLPRQCHTGGYAQCFRADALRRAGGFSERLWRYVLLDHEIMQRVFKQGAARYHPDLWCRPSPRRSDRSTVRWTLFERLIYHATPFAAKDWYFYRFLAPRLARRRLGHLNLRAKSWEQPGG